MRASLLAAIALAVPAVVLASGCTAADSPEATAPEQQQADMPKLGLMTTLPILWAEGDDFGAMLSADAESHWALEVLGERHRVAALDVLSADSLAPLSLLVLAQPRMLSAGENVALDDWVRGGGHVLVFADPMLTGHSDYGIGDKRRPQDVALIDTILARWGLAMEAAPSRTEAGFVRLGDAELPLDAAGSFVRRAPAGGAPADCADRLGSTLVTCEIGQGRAVLLADAAVLDKGEGSQVPAAAALRELLAMAETAPVITPVKKQGKNGE